MSLSVLHLSTSDNVGGSGRSAYKVHCGLRRLGVQSRMLVRDRVTSDADVGKLSSHGWKLADKAAEVVTEALGLQYLFVPSSLALLQHPWYLAADVIQLYNTHGNYLSHTVLPRMCREKKVVWRLSDMWPFTGHCAFAGSCERWQTGCGSCPDLQSYPGLRRDTTAFLWQQKRRLYARSAFEVVAPSRWIGDLAARSPLLRDKPLHLVRNGIDTKVFKPLPRALCRQVLGLPVEGKAVLFLGHVVSDNPRKGSAIFLRAIQALQRLLPGGFQVMLVGEGALHWGRDWPCPVWRHDLVREDELLAMIYNAADVLVHPAVVENLPNSVLEGMACGLPAVAFDAGGVAEIVTHGQTGYLAGLGDEAALTASLRHLLEADAERLALGRNARAAILAEYTIEQQASAFLSLYAGDRAQRAAA